MIEACAAVGIPAFKYNMSLLGVLRTDSTPGRGGTQLQHLEAGRGQTPTQLTRAGKVSSRHGLGANHLFSRPRDPGVQTSTRFARPAIRTIPACRRRAFRASCTCWAPLMG